MKFLLVILLLVVSFAQASELASVMLIKGEATRANVKEPLKVGDKVYPGQVIYTGPKSFIRLKFSDGIALQAGADSELHVYKKVGEATLVDLVKGSLLSHIRREAKSNKEKYRVKTREAIMGVRGTTFYTHVPTGKKPIFLCTCDGKLAVKHRGVERVVETTNHQEPAFLGDTWEKVTNKENINPHSNEDIAALQALVP